MWLDRVRSHPSAVLLGAQLLAVVVYPFLEGNEVGQLVLSLFGLVVLALAVWLVRSTPATTWVSWLLGLPVLLLTVAAFLWPDNEALALASAVLHSAFYFYTAYAIIRYLFTDTHVTADDMFGVGAAFTVLAWAFAFLYTATQILWPGSFIAYDTEAATRSWTELLFLSFTTLTSTGLSDVVPVLPNARSFVMIEEVAGMLYVAMVVARMVGLTINRGRV
ncbi:ion channel [Actinomycetota bacterium]